MNPRSQHLSDSAIPTILLVDDAPSNLELLKGLLKDSGHNLVTAKDGREALQSIVENPPDLILLDVMMPEVDGFAVCCAVKSDDRTRRIPVIMLTALNEVDDYIRAIQCGADDFLTKPFNPHVLMARVKGYIHAKQMADEIDRQKEFRHDLMRMVAHDLNNHMGAVLGYLELLMTRSSIPDGDRRKVEKAQQSAEEAARMLRNFMTLEKWDAGTLTTTCQDLDLCEELRRATQMKEIVLQKKALELVMEGATSCICSFDPELTSRTIHNLLDNAVKYAPPGTPIRIGVETNDGGVAFTISNSGPAIPAEDLNRVFDRFYQVKSGDVLQSRGTGLGLAFCKMAVEAQGGIITIVSPNPGESAGVTFCVSLQPRSESGALETPPETAETEQVCGVEA